MKKVIRKFNLGSESNRSVLTLMVGTIFAQAIPIGMSPLLARMYTPEEFGFFAFFIAFFSILSAVSTGRYELAVILPKRDKDAFLVCVASFFLVVVFCVFVLFLLFIYNSGLYGVFHGEKLGYLFYFLPACVALSGFVQTFSYLYIRKKSFNAIALNRAMQGGGTSAFQVVASTFAVSSGLLIGFVAGQVLSLFHFLRLAWGDRLYADISSFKTSELLNIYRRYSKFPRYDVPSSLASLGASQLPLILLPVFFTTHAGGVYYLVQRVLQAPVTLVSSSVLDVFKQKVSANFENKNEVRRVFLKTFFLLLGISLPVSGALFFLVEDIFVILMGETWRESGELAKILIPALFLRFIANPLSFMFYVSGRQGTNLIGMLLLFCGIFLSLFFSPDLVSCVAMISVSYSVVYFFYIFLSFRLARVF